MGSRLGWVEAPSWRIQAAGTASTLSIFDAPKKALFFGEKSAGGIDESDAPSQRERVWIGPVLSCESDEDQRVAFFGRAEGKGEEGRFDITRHNHFEMDGILDRFLMIRVFFQSNREVEAGPLFRPGANDDVAAGIFTVGKEFRDAKKLPAVAVFGSRAFDLGLCLGKNRAKQKGRAEEKQSTSAGVEDG